MLALHILAMCLEIGIVAATMTSLLSDLNHPHLSSPSDTHARKKKEREIVATIVSIAASCTTFVLTMLGAGDIIKGFRVVSTRISAAGKAFVARMSATSSRRHSQRVPSGRDCWAEVTRSQPGNQSDS
jgi:hypothetical protein